MAKENRGPEVVESMEELDNEMMMAMEEAEAEIKEYPNYWWSGKLHKAHLLVDYWRAQISFSRN
eukprot:5788984-Ditylum_brightwellii.AAC.1